MIPILFRTLLIYVLLCLVMRLMGKRQIAELEPSELITTLLLSELAVLPIENQDVPLLYAVIPIVTVVTLEIGISVLLTHSASLRRRDPNTPGILIDRGEICQEELANNRMSPEELLASLRQQGIVDPREVEYAILEKNGALSIIPWARHRPITPEDLGRKINENGIMHLVVSGGAINERSLCHLGKDAAWVERVCREHQIRRQDVYCLLCNDAQQLIVIPVQKNKKRKR